MNRFRKLKNSNKHLKLSNLSKFSANIVYSSDSDCEYRVVQIVTKMTNKKNQNSFSCNYCLSTFRKKTNLDLHTHRYHSYEINTEIEQETTENTLSCQFCPEEFREKFKLNSHLEKYHKIIKITDNLSNSDSDAKVKVFKCDYCQKRFREQVYLESHVNNFHKSVYSCTICLKQFRENFYLISHINKFHNETIENEQSCSNLNTDNNELLIEIPENYDFHLEDNEDPLKDTESNNETEICTGKDEAVIELDEFICNFCLEHFSEEIDLIVHIGTCQSRKNQLNTDQIEDSNFDETLLETNFNDSNDDGLPNENTNLCHLCGKKFLTNRSLKIHLRYHRQTKKYLCTQCGSKFKTGQHLKRHMLSHTKDFRFQCPYCSKKLTNSICLTEHIRTHTGEKPHTCEICSKSFSHYNGLKQHIRRHSKVFTIVCNICNKGFHEKSEHRQHLQRHIGERPYICNVCGFRFVTSRCLTKHLEKHPGARKFKCQFCKEEFHQQSLVQEHQLTSQTCMKKIV